MAYATRNASKQATTNDNQYTIIEQVPFDHQTVIPSVGMIFKHHHANMNHFIKRLSGLYTIRGDVNRMINRANKLFLTIP